MATTGLGISGSDSIAQTRGITQQDFLRILSTQLTFQDPLKPIDNQQFMAQMAQFSSLEQTRMSNEKLDTLLAQQAANQSIGLIGKTVEVQTANGNVAGQVTTISFSSGQPMLTVKAASGELMTDVALTQVALVRGSAT
ncbi:flagellar hook capping protein [Chromobacterium vaccinii]|uniref:Basal-body rod modification protein FlgD n=1 Tax=Chromobacterium indicum TaxID=3110228 RepID=A0ABV0CDE1_9NEIS|nr:flagellar hook capping FlgD N-terminal domain-containing protein [Chromobacterium vaccinii]MCD4487133.1 flagellar hook capping protein [Chromobacterium vaccinii]MCD4501049.1 flagellar hook capping protein [Chromobacterium vaccinii]QND84828.1 Flagellar basal-body rod modification protein FlgD [Chromobacterium vaccinii]QND90059.1 Flagellar basal-body rod modification protein FlgD [Chromobacterium vaccinii]